MATILRLQELKKLYIHKRYFYCPVAGCTTIRAFDGHCAEHGCALNHKIIDLQTHRWLGNVIVMHMVQPILSSCFDRIAKSTKHISKCAPRIRP